MLGASQRKMTVRKQPSPQASKATLAELFAWLDDFHKRCDDFDEATTPLRVYDLTLRALGLKSVLREDTCSAEFRKGGTANFRRFVRELKEWDHEFQVKTTPRA